MCSKEDPVPQEYLWNDWNKTTGLPRSVRPSNPRQSQRTLPKDEVFTLEKDARIAETGVSVVLGNTISRFVASFHANQPLSGLVVLMVLVAIFSLIPLFLAAWRAMAPATFWERCQNILSMSVTWYIVVIIAAIFALMGSCSGLHHDFHSFEQMRAELYSRSAAGEGPGLLKLPDVGSDQEWGKVQSS